MEVSLTAPTRGLLCRVTSLQSLASIPQTREWGPSLGKDPSRNGDLGQALCLRWEHRGHSACFSLPSPTDSLRKSLPLVPIGERETFA